MAEPNKRPFIYARGSPHAKDSAWRRFDKAQGTHVCCVSCLHLMGCRASGGGSRDRGPHVAVSGWPLLVYMDVPVFCMKKSVGL